MEAKTIGFQKFDLTDNAITSVSLALLLASIFLLWNDDLLYGWLANGRGARPIVASVNPNKTDVRFKNFDDFSWYPLKSLSNVWNDDSVFTGDEAQAYITFKDGSRLLLGQNSMVRLHMDEKTGAIQVDLQRGSVEVTPAPAAVINIKNKDKTSQAVANQASKFESPDHPSVMVAVAPLPPPQAPAPKAQPAPQKVVQNTPPHQKHVQKIARPTPKPVKRMIAQVAAQPKPAPVPAPAPPPEPEFQQESLYKNITHSDTTRSTSTPDDYPFETLASISLLYSPGGTAFQGAAAVSAWLRAIHINKIEEARVRRLGVSAEYTNYLTNGTTSDGTSFGVTTINANLKYNIIYGSWYRDSIFGILAGYQNLTIGTNNAGLVTSGLYFGAPIPHFIDKILNVIPFMRHHKWMEAQLKYMTIPLDSNYTTTGNYEFTLSGKVFLKDTFFIYGAAGFDSYNLLNTTTTMSTNVTTLFGSGGVGAQF